MEKASLRYNKCQDIKLRNAHCRQVRSLIRGYATYPHCNATCVLYINCAVQFPSPNWIL